MISKQRLVTEVEMALKGGKLISRNKLSNKDIPKGYAPSN